MATTTTNFGWDIPQSTDLVKDGATAIAALGQDIDTALVDLKGGTTGQILAKASNTDLDYSWITNDVGDITAVTAGTGISGGGTSGAVTITNSMATEIDAKGDLIAGTGADAFSCLAVGSNGESLVADSSTSTGLRWQGSLAAGKNFITNGAMEIAQRGTSVSAGTANVYGLDRWYTSGFGSGQAFTVAQGTSSPPTGFRYYQSITQTSANSTNLYVSQSLETTDVIRLAGKTATLSFIYKIPTNFTSQWVYNIVYSTATDTNLAPFATRTTITSASLANTTSWTNASVTFAVPSNATSFAIEFSNGNSTVNNANFQLTGVQLEIGSVATSFTRIGGSIQGELAACQRYLPAIAASNGEIFTGQCYSSTAALIPVIFPVTARVAPTGITVNSAGNFRVRSSTASKLTTTAINFSTGTVIGSTIEAVVSTGLTAGNATNLFNESAGTILFTGCEL